MDPTAPSITFFDKERGPHTALLSGRPIQFGGEPAVVWQALDITAQTEVEHRLAQLARLESLAVMAGGLAHDINNPLAYVITNLEMLQLELADNDTADIKGLVDTGLEGAIRVRDIVSDLHSFSRPDEESVFPVEVQPGA